jgi:hypothetical protein
MMRGIALILLSCAGASLAQYDDYPVGQYEFAHHRIVVSPLKLMGGMDGSKRDEGPKVDLKWTPNIDIQELRYEYVIGDDGTFGVGPMGTFYLGLDSIKVSSWAVGVYGRYYLGLGTGPYAQFNLQWYQQTQTKLHDGNAVDTFGNKLPSTTVDVSGPQISPVLGYNAIFSNHFVLETQMGFSIGYYNVSMPNSVLTVGGSGLPKLYKSGSQWGGFYFVQLALGFAW